MGGGGSSVGGPGDAERAGREEVQIDSWRRSCRSEEGFVFPKGIRF